MVNRLEELQDIVDAETVMAGISAGEETYPAELAQRLVAGTIRFGGWSEIKKPRRGGFV